jgi:hypothetical protein
MAFKALVIATFVLVPTLAFAQPSQKQACKNDAFAGCVSPKMQKAMNAHAQISEVSQAELHGRSYGDANSMDGWNSAAGNAAGRTGGGAGGGGSSGGE